MKPAIAVSHLSKRYTLGPSLEGNYRTLRETLNAAALRPWRRLRQLVKPTAANREAAAPILWALRDVSLEIQQGDIIGVIGRNGAGKSTFLKILSRITEPTSGRAELRGRVGSLLEVGTGFHLELTGRENIYLNGAILGMSRREITRKFDAIVAFAEVEQFLDTPVKRYSSGMFVRLAFAVASHLDPEILLVDEVLAVGDAAFQKKCLGKMGEVSRSGRTVLFVSHNMATILHLCEKVALFDQGQLAFLGDTEKGMQLYIGSAGVPGGGEADLANHPRRRPGCPPILGSIRLLNSQGVATDQFQCGEPITVEIRVDPRSTVGQPHFAIGFEDTLGCRLFTVATYLSDRAADAARCRSGVVCRLNEVPLAPGRYALSLNAGPREWVWTDFIDQAMWVEVTAANYYANGQLPNPEWGRFLVRSRWDAVER
jgi:lipopolysaccharide transport system ATP-binding protein